MDNNNQNNVLMNSPIIPTELPPQELQYFKEKVKRWLLIDKQVSDLEGQIKEIKKVKKRINARNYSIYGSI